MRPTLLIALSILCLATAGCEDTDVGMAIDAGKDAVQTATLSDEDVQRLALEVARRSDQKHSVAPPDNPYARRLQQLVGRARHHGGHTFNYKVYLSPTVNAFAMAERMRASDYDPHKVEGPSVLERLWSRIKGLWPFGRNASDPG